MKKLYVGNLSYSTSEAELRNLFEVHGAVQKVTIVTVLATGISRGFGLVEMTNAGEADRAIAALNGTHLGGRRLTIKDATAQQECLGGWADDHGRYAYRGPKRQPQEPRW